MSTSWDGDREEYDMVPLYVLWNAPGGCYDYAGGNFKEHFIRCKYSRLWSLLAAGAFVQIVLAARSNQMRGRCI